MMIASQHKSLFINAEDGILLEGYQWGEMNAENGVIFCQHGLSSNALWFAPLAVALTEKGYCVVAVNRRGSGGSKGRRMYAKNLSVLLDDLDLWMGEFKNAQSVKCVGHCWGAMLAKKWVEVRNPSISECICIVPPYKTIFDKKWHRLMIHIGAFVAAGMRVKLPYGAEIFSDDTDLVETIKKEKMLESHVTLGLLIIGNELKQVNDDWSQCRVIVAADDKLITDCWSWLDDVCMVGNAGHGLILECPEAVVELL